MKLEIPFNGPAYKSDSWVISAQECINFFLHSYPGGVALWGCPGMEPWLDLGSEIRCSLVYGDLLYVVAGRNFYSVDKTGGTTLLGSVATTSGMLGISTNGIDIVIVERSAGYVYNISTGSFSQITDPDFPGGDMVVYIDGYYLVNNPNSGEVWRSDWNDGSSWGGLAFSTAGRDPDDVVSLLVDHSDVWVMGEKTIELWYNTGESTFNFANIPGAVIDTGVVGPYARTRINNAVYWISQDEYGQGMVFEAVGRVPTVISTPPITKDLESRDLSDAFMFSYTQMGHSFVVINIGDVTWVYDSTEKEWHQRSSRVSGVDGRWIANTVSFFGGNHIVGCNDGKLSLLKLDEYEENGNPIIGTRTTGIVRDKQNRITVNEVEVISESGVGLSSGDSQDTDPKAMFSWSRDGGKTWSPEVDVSLGKVGEYSVSRITQLGQGISWVFRWKISAAVRRVIVGAVAYVEVDR